MTEYELVDAAGTFFEIALGTLMGYFSVFTAYLVVACLVGSKLDRQQVAVVNGLFLIMQLLMIWGTAGFFWQARGYMDQVREAPLGAIAPHHVALPLLSIGVIVGFKFMWDIRNPKTE
jgi:hypothetical protein